MGREDGGKASSKAVKRPSKASSKAVKRPSKASSKAVQRPSKASSKAGMFFLPLGRRVSLFDVH